jgi:hypothetical protein
MMRVRHVPWLALLSSTAAADVTPLSRLPSQPARVEHGGGGALPKGVSLFNHWYQPSVQLELQVVAPYCGFKSIPPDWSKGDGDIALGQLEREFDEFIRSKPDGTIGLERLIEHDGHAELERITVSATPYPPEVDRSRIALAPVGRLDETVIYAYRYGDNVFLVARARPTADVRFGSIFGDAEDGVDPRCGLALPQLRLDGVSSENVRILDSHPPCTRIDASISKTSRDVEPLLAVTARHVPCH